MKKKQKNNMNFSFDQEFDVLYINLIEKTDSYGDETDEGLVIMKDMATNKITGYTIFDFMEKYLNKTLDKLPLPIPINFEADIISKLNIKQ